MDEIKITEIERRTIGVMDSANPFAESPVQRTFGKPTPIKMAAVVQSNIPVTVVDPIAIKQEMPEIEGVRVDEGFAIKQEIPTNKESLTVQKRRCRPPKDRSLAAEVLENAKTPNRDIPKMDQITGEQAEHSYHNPIHESRSKEGLPSYRCEFEGRDIFIAHPWYKTSNPVTTHINLALALDFGRDKIRFDLSMGDAVIYHSRNDLCRKFLETDAKWMLMMDDDMLPCIGRPNWYRYWVPKNRGDGDAVLGRHILHRLIGTGKTLVGGAYFGRQEGAPLMCSNQALVPMARVYEERVEAVDWVGTGCILIHRNVLRDIREAYPELGSKKEGGNFGYFHPMDTDTGEDISFCVRAKKAGHQPHVELGTPIGHLGYRVY